MEITQDGSRAARFRCWRTCLIILGLIVLQGIGALWHLAGLQTVGGEDTAHYYAVAKNIARGKADPDDVLWHYLGRPSSVERPAGDYWGPGWPYALGFLMRLFGDSPIAALRICAVLSVLLPVMVFLLLQRLTAHWWAAAFGGVLVCLQRKLLPAMVTPDVSMCYALTCMAGFVLFLGFLKGRPTLLRLLPSAFVLTLPMWLRGEGFIPVVAATIGLLTGPWTWRQRMRCAVGFAALVGICLVPYVVYNIHFFGRLTPEPRSLTPLMTDYKQLYEFGDGPSFDAYFKLGLKGIVRLRVDAVAYFAESVWLNTPYLLLLAAMLGPVLRWIAYRRRATPASSQSGTIVDARASGASGSGQAAGGLDCGCAAGIVTLWSFVILSAAVPMLIAPIVANFDRFLSNTTPVLCVLAVWAIAPLLRYRWCVNLGLLLVATLLLAWLYWPFQPRKPWKTAWKGRYSDIPAALAPGNHPPLNADDIVLTEMPCRLSATLGVRSIMAPWDDTVIEVSDGSEKYLQFSSAKRTALSGKTCREVIDYYHPQFILADDGSILDQFIKRMKDLPLRVVYRGKKQDGQGYTWYAVPKEKAPAPASH